MRINFDFLDLEAFLAVKETASFHAASERLNLSQSSVTRRVQKLETALGTLLFERTTREVRPTLAAKRLQLRAEAILADAQETTRAMRDDQAASAYLRSQIVTLAAVPSVLGSLVCPAIEAFRGAGHTARIRILDLAANEVAEAVGQGEADFGICSIPELEPTIRFDLLFSEPIVLVAHKDHPLANAKGVTWTDLSEQRLILPARGTGNRLLIDEALARTKDHVRWTYEVGRSTSALEMAARRLGVALLPETAMAGPLSDLVVSRPISDPVISRPIGLISRMGQTETPAARSLKAALLAKKRS